MCKLGGRDHNATSYSTETFLLVLKIALGLDVEIITLRAIALKLTRPQAIQTLLIVEIITLRAIALKQISSTTNRFGPRKVEIITLRAIALKRVMISEDVSTASLCRDHNATSYSTETHYGLLTETLFNRRDHNATSYSTETSTSHRAWCETQTVEIITLRAIALNLLASRCPYGLPVEIITLRAIALKPRPITERASLSVVEIITLRAIALKRHGVHGHRASTLRRDHNATSYSTETLKVVPMMSDILV